MTPTNGGWRASFAKSGFAHHVAFSSDFWCGSFALVGVGGDADEHGFQLDLGLEPERFQYERSARKDHHDP